MSIAAPSSPSPSQGKVGARSVGADQLIEDRITEACNALWWAEVTRAILQLVVIAIGVLLGWIVIDQWIYSPGSVARLVMFTASAAGLTWYAMGRIIPLLRSTIQPEYAARSLEHDMPELRQSLTSYVTLRGDQKVAGLRNRMVRSMGAVTAGRLRAHDALPVEATGTMRWWIATAVALAMFLAYAAASPKNSLQSAKRLAIPFASIEAPRRVSIEDVQPGDVAAIAGRIIEVSASIDGMRGGEEAYCRWDLPSGRREVVLVEDADSGDHVGQIELPHSASGEVPYVISAGDATAGPFRLRVQDVPVVALQAVRYEPPKYTRQPAHSTSSGAITALDGTRVTIQATTNRAVARAKIEFNPRPIGDELQATAGASEMEIDATGTSLSVSFPLRSARGRSAAVELESYRIKVWDAVEQSNPDPIIYPIRVIADLPPEVSITMPLESPQDVPINAQQIIEVHASDPDFGLKVLRLEIRSGRTVIAEPILWSDPQGATGNRVAEYPFRPAKHDLAIGSTVQVVAVAIDNRSAEDDPSVEPNVRRTDAVELRIKAAENLPANGDPNSGGLSSPEESKPKEERSESQDQGGDQQSGGGGGGGEGQQQQGGSQEGGESSAGGQSGDQSEGQTGEGETGEGETGEGETGEGETGEGETGEGETGEGETGEGETGEGETGEGETGEGKTGEGKTGEGQTGEGQTGEGQTGEGQTGEGQTGEGQTGEGQTGAGQSGQGQSGEGESGQRDGGQNEAPKHDGETFERIRDYIEKQRQSQSQSGGSDSQGQSGQSGESQSSDSAAREPGAGEQPNTDPSEGQGSSNESSANGEKSGSAQSRDTSSSKDSSSGAGSEQQQSESGDQSRQPSGQGDDAASGQKDSGASSDDSGKQEGAQGEGSESSQADGEGSESKTGEGQSAQSQGASPSDSGTEGSSGDPQASQNGQGGSSGDDSAEGGEQSSASEESKQSSNDGSRSGDRSEGQSQSSTSESGEKDQTASSSEGQSSERSSSAGGEMESNPSQSSGATGGAGVGGNDEGQAGDAPITPDPVDLDYAKKATDMVLDYLQDTRDAPDQALLDELKWSEEDLRKFSERWQSVREMNQANPADAGDNAEVTEALESLGLRPTNMQRQDRVRDSADSLRTIRDSGNRKPPPPAFRDAFDAFRRAMGRKD